MMQNSVPQHPELQSLIDAMKDGAAIIAADGTILWVNDTWRKFAAANEGDTADEYIGVNYLDVCRQSSDAGDELARRVGTGIGGVLSGGEEFSTEYPCHSPTEKRWFEIIARPFGLSDQKYALIAHRNVTSRVEASVEASHAEQNVENLAAIVATMPDAVIAFDLDGKIISWNAAAYKLYGYERDEVIGESIEILYPPNWPAKVSDYIADIITRELRSFDVVRQTKYGDKRTIAVTAAPIRSITGEIIGIYNVHRDVTDERAAEQRLRNVLDNLFAFVGILGPDGTLLEANRAPLEAANLVSTDVIGKKFWDTYWWNHAPDVQERLIQACKDALKGELIRYDEQVRIADGRLVWIDFQVAPLKDLDGKIVNLIPSGIDITARKKMVEALKTSHDTFQNLVAKSPFGIYTVDEDFRLAHVSDGARSVFENVDPLIGHDFEAAFRTVWAEPFASEAIGLFRHTLATGEPYQAPSSTKMRQDTSEIESYDWRIERITMPDGRLGVVCNFYDLSERQRYEHHVRMLMREVNHRSKNLLTVVLSMARQTARNSLPVDFVERFSERLRGLSASQDLIVKRNWDGVGVRELVLSQMNHLSEEVRDNRVQVDGPEIIISPSAAEGIGMALHELATNALKYGALSVADGTVLVQWNLQQADQEFSINWREMNGPAVSPPERRGFGRIVIERMAANSVGGSVELDYDPTGVRWNLTAPLDGVRNKVSTLA